MNESCAHAGNVANDMWAAASLSDTRPHTRGIATGADLQTSTTRFESELAAKLRDSHHCPHLHDN
eukprot:11140974-Lingulodinium_polyedra.AAC.1